MQVPLMRWFDVHQIRPHIVGEFDDSALMQAFSKPAPVFFIAPSVIADEVQREHGVIILGQTDEVTEQFYAISMERRLTHRPWLPSMTLPKGNSSLICIPMSARWANLGSSRCLTSERGFLYDKTLAPLNHAYFPLEVVKKSNSLIRLTKLAGSSS